MLAGSVMVANWNMTWWVICVHGEVACSRNSRMLIYEGWHMFLLSQKRVNEYFKRNCINLSYSYCKPKSAYFSVQSTQLYGRSRQCGRPVGALIEWEFHSNPLIIGLIQHTFKINLLYVTPRPENRCNLYFTKTFFLQNS